MVDIMTISLGLREMPDDHKLSDVEASELRMAAFFQMPLIIYMNGVGLNSSILWYFSLKVGVSLAHDDVTEVVKRTTLQALANDKTFTTHVARPAIALATGTMSHLSTGWGKATGMMALLFMVASLANFLKLVHAIITNGSTPHQSATYAVGSCAILVPVFLAWDTAQVSSLCDKLVDTINNLRLTWDSTEAAQAVHLRTAPLLDTLSKLNSGQGAANLVFSSLVGTFRLSVQNSRP